ncbi:hypothetical protein ACIOEX_32680, partial [Streptomyces sp. NPDC087850]
MTDTETMIRRPADQSLANGAAGIALHHIERALTGAGPWQSAHSWLTATVSRQISSTDTACLTYGAPAVAFALHCAQADGT